MHLLKREGFGRFDFICGTRAIELIFLARNEREHLDGMPLFLKFSGYQVFELGVGWPVAVNVVQAGEPGVHTITTCKADDVEQGVASFQFRT